LIFHARPYVEQYAFCPRTIKINATLARDPPLIFLICAAAAAPQVRLNTPALSARAPEGDMPPAFDFYTRRKGEIEAETVTP